MTKRSHSHEFNWFELSESDIVWQMNNLVLHCSIWGVKNNNNNNNKKSICYTKQNKIKQNNTTKQNKKTTKKQQFIKYVGLTLRSGGSS